MPLAIRGRGELPGNLLDCGAESGWVEIARARRRASRWRGHAGRSIAVIRGTATGIEIDVSVIPNPRKTACAACEIPRRWSGSLRRPIDSATNDTLNEFLCDLLHVPIGALRISSGERSCRKHVSTDASKAMRCGGALKLIVEIDIRLAGTKRTAGSR